MQVADAVLCELLQLLSIQEIQFGVTTAEEQHGRPKRRAFSFARRAFLQKAAKRRETGAGPDHDDRNGSVREPESGLRLPDAGIDLVALLPVG